MTHDFTNKVAVVTGAASGIGAAIAHRLAASGAHAAASASTRLDRRSLIRRCCRRILTPQLWQLSPACIRWVDWEHRRKSRP